ncbi:MAG: hypothetical protein AAF688_12515 [Bacteroidota bacterium]
MKTFKIIMLAFICSQSCTEQKKESGLNEKLNKIISSNENLERRLDSINNNFVRPFETYERIVNQERENHPDSTITKYKSLIKKYPNSFWKHESEKRIKNIEKRKKYWTKENGWKLEDIPKKPNFDEQVISCPGC